MGEMFCANQEGRLKGKKARDPGNHSMLGIDRGKNVGKGECGGVLFADTHSCLRYSLPLCPSRPE